MEIAANYAYTLTANPLCRKCLVLPVMLAVGQEFWGQSRRREPADIYANQECRGPLSPGLRPVLRSQLAPYAGEDRKLNAAVDRMNEEGEGEVERGRLFGRNGAA